MRASPIAASIAKSLLRALPAASVLALGPALYARQWHAIAARVDEDLLVRFEAQVKGTVFNGVGEHAAAYLFIHPVPLALAGYATLFAAPWAVVLWATFQPRRERLTLARFAGYLAGFYSLLLVPYAIGALASLGLREVASPLELSTSTLGLYARCAAGVLPHAALSFGMCALIRFRVVASLLSALAIALLEAAGDAVSLRLAQSATSYETSSALSHLAMSLAWFSLFTLVFLGARRLSQGGLRKLQEV